VIHVAENTRRSRSIGVPRLQPVINTLFDIEKVAGSSSEAFWRAVYQGLVFTTKDDYEIPSDGDASFSDLENQIDEFINDWSKYIFAEGLEKVTPIKSDISSPKEHFTILISQASGETGIPQRILIGSERGELASEQDDKNFADVIEVRRTKHAEPLFIRPFVDFCIKQRLIPPPNAGKYSVEHQSLFELNEIEKADVAYKIAQAIYVLSRNKPGALNAFPFDQFVKKYLGFALTGSGKTQIPEQIPEEPVNDQPPA